MEKMDEQICLDSDIIINFLKKDEKINEETKKELEKIAGILAKRDNIFFTIEGHVCCTSDTKDAIDRSTKKRNLSIARAKYVYDFLLKKGVKKYRMKYVGMERKYPLGGDPKYDRRVEFLITYVGKN